MCAVIERDAANQGWTCTSPSKVGSVRDRPRADALICPENGTIGTGSGVVSRLGGGHGPGLRDSGGIVAMANYALCSDPVEFISAVSERHFDDVQFQRSSSPCSIVRSQARILPSTYKIRERRRCSSFRRRRQTHGGRAAARGTAGAQVRSRCAAEALRYGTRPPRRHRASRAA